MPIYAYRCEACGFARDALQKLSDPPLTTCSACGQETLRKQVTAAGFQLKGSGWYVTDFRNGSAKPGAAADGAANASKPAATTDTAASTGTAAPATAGAAPSTPSTPAAGS